MIIVGIIFIIIAISGSYQAPTRMFKAMSCLTPD